MAEGQITWKSRGNKSSATSQGEKEFVVSPLIERKLFTEYRLRSVFGQLSKDVETRMVSDKRRMREIDISTSAAVMSKTVTNADEVRFNMVQNIKGASTYGDAPVETGDYLSYLHASMKVNYRHSPAQQLTGNMGKLRAGDLVNGEESEIRTQFAYYWGEELTFESYRGLLMGQSMDLSISELDGGVQQDLGRGFYDGTGSAGNLVGGFTPPANFSRQVSCENFFTMANGGEFVSAPVYGTGTALATNLTAYEQRIATSIITLQNSINTDVGGGTNAEKQAVIKKYGMRRGILSDMRDMVVQKRIKPIKMNGADKWILLMDSKLIRDLQATNGELYSILQTTQQGKGESDIFLTGYKTWEIEDFIIVRDPYLDLFRPQFTGAGAAADDTEISYGKIAFDRDPRSNMIASVDSGIALAVVLGEGALMSGNINGAVEITYEKGTHGQGAELASHNAFSVSRTRWMPKDGRKSAQTIVNQNSMVLAFSYNKSLIGAY